MKRDSRQSRFNRFNHPVKRGAGLIVLMVWGLLAAGHAKAAGTWSALVHSPPAGLNNALLLSDGTVICGNGGSNWFRLTPDTFGSYVNGTWSPIASTKYTRLFYTSQVLTNGNVYVAGGEYGTGGSHAERYDTLNNTWVDVPQPASNPHYSDAISKTLPDGNVLQGTTGTGVWIYNAASNVISAAASARNQNEACWVRLPNDNILTIDAFGQQSEHYVPSLNQWFNDANVPVVVYGYGGELGPGFVLPNGKVFFIGGTVNTAIYTPGGSLTTAGTWTAGPTMINNGTNGLGAVDAPAAMLANGKIFCAIGPTNGFNGPTYFYEYDYIANSFTQVNGPTGPTFNTAPFATTMLDLPDGTVLYISGQGTTSLYIYRPDGTPLVAGQPVVADINENVDGSYHLAGTGLNGIAHGAAYGDDWQMDSNYPLVRMTNNLSGLVYYARTYNWSSTTIQNTNSVTTEFSLPPNLPAGTYSLLVVANGNPSAPVAFNYAPPAPPSGVTALAGNAQVSVSWNPVAGATAYSVKRATVGGGAYYVPVATVTDTNYLDTGLVNGVTYYYVITAVGSGGPSGYSSQVSAIPVGPPPPPTGLAGSVSTPTMVTAWWNASFGALSYNLKRSTHNGGPYTVIANPSAENYSDATVASGTTYYYVVSAVGPNGESADSAPISLTTLPPPWVTFDVGSVAATGSGTFSNNVFTVSGSGADIWGTNDAFRYVYQAVGGDCDVHARVVSVSNTSGGAKAAVMLRAALDAGSAEAMMDVQAANGLEFIWRAVAGGSSSSSTLSGVTAPYWVRLTRTNNTFTAYRSPNGSVWTQVGTPQTIAMPGTFYVGLAVCAHNDGAICTARFDNVTVSSTAPPAPPAAPAGLSVSGDDGQVNLAWNPSAGATLYNVKRATTSGGPYTIVGTPLTAGSLTSTNFTDSALGGGATYYYVVSALNAGGESTNSAEVSIATLPSPWITGDVGAVAAKGSASYSNSIFTVKGSGADIWGTEDGFRFVYQAINGDCEISARVAGVQNTASAAKAGVMIRASPNEDSPHALMAVTPFSGLEFLLRALDANPTGSSVVAGAAPYWVRVKRAGGTFTAYRSINGVAWTQVGSPQTLTAGRSVYVGLAVCSHNDGALCTATFDNVSVSSSPAAPTGLVASATNTQVNLSWIASSGATGYNVKRSTAAGGPYATMASPTGAAFVDSGLTNGVTYYYVVSATNSFGESPDSAEAAATVLLPPIVLSVGPAMDGQFSFSFTATDGQNYVVETSTNLLDWQTVLTNTPVGGVFDFTDTNAADVARFYRVFRP